MKTLCATVDLFDRGQFACYGASIPDVEHVRNTDFHWDFRVVVEATINELCDYLDSSNAVNQNSNKVVNEPVVTY